MTAKERYIEKLRRTQGCLTDAVAYYLNLHPERVPLFIYPARPAKAWNQRLKAFFKRHGFIIMWKCCTRVPKRGMHIVNGPSSTHKNWDHAVVYKDGRLVFDPQYPSRWRNNKVTHRLVVRKIA